MVKFLEGLRDLEGTGRKFEGSVYRHLRSVRDHIVKSNGAKCVDIIPEPNGSQAFPDIRLWFDDGTELDIECKTNKSDRIMMNDGIGHWDAIYIFKNYGKKSPGVTYFWGSRIFNPDDFVKRELYDKIKKQLVELTNDCIDEVGDGDLSLEMYRPRWYYPRNKNLTTDPDTVKFEQQLRGFFRD